MGKSCFYVGGHMAAKKITIKRKPGVFNAFPACSILSDEVTIGKMDENQMEASFNVSKAEHAIQAQITTEDGRIYRSNSYFSIGGKDVTLYLVIDGSKLKLTYRE